MKEDQKFLFWQKSLGMQRTILDSLIEHVVVHDMEWKVLWANTSACKSVDLQLEQVVGRFCYEIWPKRSVPCEDCPVSLSRTTGLPQSIEKKTPDGRCWQISASPVFDDDGRMVAMIELTLDITERVKAEEDLKRIQIDQEQLIRERTLDLIHANDRLKKEIEDRKKTELVLRKQKDDIQQLAMELSKAEDRERQRIAEVLHGDLQQMLAYLKLKFNNLTTAASGDAVFAGISDLIDNCIQRCRHLSRELKPFAVHNKDFMSALSQVCRQMKDFYGLRVFLRVDERPEMHSSVLSSLLIRSIRELLFNAVKHSGVDQVWVEVCFENRQMLITVKDSGAGCDPDDLRTIRENNTAFGLFDIEDRVNFLGGNMHIETAPGKGFCVTLRIPRDVCSPSEIARPDTAATGLPDIIKERYAGNSPVLTEKGPVRILLADDHAIMRDGLAELIGGYAGIEVVGLAANGQEAVELAAELRPSVVLMDVSMPLMNGIEATRLIADFFPDVQVIGLTMHQDPGIHQEMLNAGARDCLSKSGAMEELVEKLLAIAYKKN